MRLVQPPGGLLLPVVLQVRPIDEPEVQPAEAPAPAADRSRRPRPGGGAARTAPVGPWTRAAPGRAPSRPPRRRRRTCRPPTPRSAPPTPASSPIGSIDHERAEGPGAVHRPPGQHQQGGQAAQQVHQQGGGGAGAARLVGRAGGRSVPPRIASDIIARARTRTRERENAAMVKRPARGAAAAGARVPRAPDPVAGRGNDVRRPCAACRVGGLSVASVVNAIRFCKPLVCSASAVAHARQPLAFGGLCPRARRCRSAKRKRRSGFPLLVRRGSGRGTAAEDRTRIERRAPSLHLLASTLSNDATSR